MPVCFDLTPRCDPGHGPMRLNDIDAGICQFLGVEVHARLYCRQWFDVIGFKLAIGKTWKEIDATLIEYIDRDIFENNRDMLRWNCDLLAISRFLQLNYIADAWRQWHK